MSNTFKKIHTSETISVRKGAYDAFLKRAQTPKSCSMREVEKGVASTPYEKRMHVHEIIGEVTYEDSLDFIHSKRGMLVSLDGMASGLPFLKGIVPKFKPILFFNDHLRIGTPSFPKETKVIPFASIVGEDTYYHSIFSMAEGAKPVKTTGKYLIFYNQN